MALRKKKTEEQQELRGAAADIAKTPPDVFYDRLNKLLSASMHEDSVSLRKFWG